MGLFKSKKSLDFKFSEDQELVARKLKTLVFVGINDDVGKIYVDPVTGQEWELHLPDEIECLYSFPKALRIYPYPNTDELLAMVKDSNNFDELKGICRLLKENQQSKETEFRTELLDFVEKNGIYRDSEKYKIIFEYADLGNHANQRDCINKRMTEIRSDHTVLT